MFRFPMKQVAGMLLGPAGTLVALTFLRRLAAVQPLVRVHTVLRRVDVRALRASHEQHEQVLRLSLALARSLYVTLSMSLYQRMVTREAGFAPRRLSWEHANL